MKSSLAHIADTVGLLDGRLLLIGGYALQAYGVVRQTMDVDVLVSKTDLSVFEKALVALKLHAMHNNPRREVRDLPDIIALLQANPDAVGETELRDLCYRYGPEGIWERINTSRAR